MTELVTADGVPLKAALAKSLARSRRRAFLLVAPLLLFILVTFVFPIGQMLYRSVYNDTFSSKMPNLTQWFAENPVGTDLGEEAYAALAADLVLLRETRTAGAVGNRINYDLPRSYSLFTSTARRANRLEPPYKDAILELKPEWDNPRLWRVMRDASSNYTMNFYLAALDRSRDESGAVVSVSEERKIYTQLFIRTFLLSVLITVLTLVLGYPIAHLLATLPLRYSNLLMIFVLLPFWTSLLVRTTSWIVLLQKQGVINSTLVALNILDDDGRLSMIYNQAGTIIAMTHILLPFMVLPLYSVMRPIPPSYVRAARSLGATSWKAFRSVYFPLTIPGIAAGGLLVFILAVGYYITPALVGGASGQLISNLIAYHMTDSLNWSLGAALASILLASILILYWLYDRLIGIDNLKLG